MVPITIGVPVYNGADLLEGSLACLARQTFRDFKVLIFDNASSDRTEEIGRAWAARDDRFHYFRQRENVGAMANFRDALLAAESPWFLWRADDDLSDDDYVQTLYDLATRSPGCKLAVSTVVLADWDLRQELVIAPPSDLDPNSTRDRIRTLFAGCPQWFYGLWDREAAGAAYCDVVGHFHYPFAADLLTIYGPIIEGAVRTTSTTRFYTRLRRAPKATRQGGRAPFAVMWDIRRGFVRNLRRMRSERALSPSLSLALAATQPYFLRKALPSLTKTLRRGARELFGVSGPRSTSWHVQRGS